MRVAPLVLLLSLALAGAGCGDEPRPRPPGPPPLVVPADPADALDWVRAAETLPGDAELRRRLAAWPVDGEEFLDTEETQTILTWRIRLALQDEDIERAHAQWQLLLADYEGHGLAPEGRGLTPDMMRLGLFEEARLQARRRIEGAAPDREAAGRALEIAASLLQPDEKEDRRRLRATRRWVELADVASLVGDAGCETSPGVGRAATLGRGRLWPHDTPLVPLDDAWHPWVLVLADDFTLGETIFVDVLQRWQREGAEAGLRVVALPLLRGQVRVGIRRVPAESAGAERASVRRRLQAAGLGLAGEGPDGFVRVDGAAPDADTLTRLAGYLAGSLGLEGQEAAVLVLDVRGRVVGRLSGMGLDPRALDPIAQRVISR